LRLANPSGGSGLSRGLYSGNQMPDWVGTDSNARNVNNDPNFHEIDRLLQRPGGVEWFSGEDDNANAGANLMSLDPYHLDDDDDAFNHD